MTDGKMLTRRQNAAFAALIAIEIAAGLSIAGVSKAAVADHEWATVGGIDDKGTIVEEDNN